RLERLRAQAPHADEHGNDTDDAHCCANDERCEPGCQNEAQSEDCGAQQDQDPREQDGAARQRRHRSSQQGARGLHELCAGQRQLIAQQRGELMRKPADQGRDRLRLALLALRSGTHRSRLNLYAHREAPEDPAMTQQTVFRSPCPRSRMQQRPPAAHPGPLGQKVATSHWEPSFHLFFVNSPAQPPMLAATVNESLRRHWGWYLVEGIVLVALGVGAVLIPVIATLAVTLVLGWILLMSGVIGLITTFRATGAPGFSWSLISGILGVIVGLLLLGWPFRGTLSLTAVLIAFLLIEGIATILYALEHRRGLFGRWGWLFASGIVDVILAVILVISLPGAALWALGLLVGINLIFGGWALIIMALFARGATSHPSGAAPMSP